MLLIFLGDETDDTIVDNEGDEIIALKIPQRSRSINFTPPDCQVLVGELDVSNVIESLSISRPLAEISTPQTWTGEMVLGRPIDDSRWLPESLDDIENPSRWGRCNHPIKIFIKGEKIATLRIASYYYDDEIHQGTAELADWLTLLDYKTPPEDYEGLGFRPCSSTTASFFVDKLLREAGFPCVSASLPGDLEVAPDKVSESYVRLAQQYCGERGYWLYMDADECVKAKKYPLRSGEHLFNRCRDEVESFRRQRSVELPDDKTIVTGSGKKYAKCERPKKEVEREYGLYISHWTGAIDPQFTDSRFVQLERTTEITLDTKEKTVEKITIRQPLLTAFAPASSNDLPGDAKSLKTVERQTITKYWDDQGRLRKQTIETDKRLGLILPDDYPYDTTMVDNAEKTVIEWFERDPTHPIQGLTVAEAQDGVIRYKSEYTWSLFAIGTASESSSGSRTFSLSSHKFVKALASKTVESWSEGEEGQIQAIGGVGLTGNKNCSCDRWRYKKRVWERGKELKTVQIADFLATSWGPGELALKSSLSEDDGDATPPSWETKEPECPVCDFDIKGEIASRMVGVGSKCTDRRNEYNASTLNTDAEAQKLARLLSKLQHHRYRARELVMPMPEEFLVDPSPFPEARIDKVDGILENVQIILTSEALEFNAICNHVGSIPPVHCPVYDQIPVPPAQNCCIPELQEETPLQIIPLNDRTFYTGRQINPILIQVIGGVKPYSISYLGLTDGLSVNDGYLIGQVEEPATIAITIEVVDNATNIASFSFNLNFVVPDPFVSLDQETTQITIDYSYLLSQYNEIPDGILYP